MDICKGPLISPSSLMGAGTMWHLMCLLQAEGGFVLLG